MPFELGGGHVPAAAGVAVLAVVAGAVAEPHLAVSLAVADLEVKGVAQPGEGLAKKAPATASALLQGRNAALPRHNHGRAALALPLRYVAVGAARPPAVSGPRLRRWAPWR